MAGQSTEDSVSREARLESVAGRMALAAYDKFASGSGAAYLGGELGSNKAQTIERLADRFQKALENEFGEDGWNEMTSLALKKAGESGALTLATHVLDGKPALGEKVEFEAFRPLFEPGDGKKDWYAMDRDVMGKTMAELGYDPKNPDMVKKFYGRLQKHNSDYLKGRAVDEFGKSPAGVAAALAYPTAYEEGVRQALSDDAPDEGNIWKAAALDAVTASLTGGAAGFGYVPGIAGSAAAETGRQVARNLVLGQKPDFTEPVMSATSMAAIPPTFRKLVGPGRRSTDKDVRGFMSEFRKGVFGEKAPYEEERNLLVKQLLEARRRGKPTVKDPNFVTRHESGLQKEWDDISDKLATLGFGSQGLAGNIDPWQAIRASQSNLHRNVAGTRQYTLKQMLGIPEDQMYMVSDKAARKELEEAMSDPDTFRVYTPDDIVTFRNRKAVLEGDANTLAKIARGMSMAEPGDEREYARVLQNAAEREKKLYEMFPKTMAAAEAGEDISGPGIRGRAARVLGGHTGKMLAVSDAYMHTPVVTGLQQMLAGDMHFAQNRQEKYKESDWYKKLRKANPEMAKALDAAMKSKGE